jgi:zinc/manganese transport system substrate-binding protein
VNRRVLLPLLPAVLAASALALSGCASGSSADAGAGSSAAATDGGAIRIVASTNVYGNLAELVGGDLVQVTSIIDSPDKDPHEYQADAQNQLALSKAQIVIENGGGYDDFVDTMLSAAGNPDAVVLNASDLSGYDQEPADGEFNEHVWYDFPTVSTLVDQLATELAAAAPADAATFEANATEVQAKLTALEGSETELKATAEGKGVAITEPVPLYLLDAVGLVNKTPDAFSEAIEQDTDVPATVLQETLDLFSTKQIALLVYNEQTGGPQTDAVVQAADANGIPAVAVTETLPAGEDYFSWMQANLDAVAGALGQ